MRTFGHSWAGALGLYLALVGGPIPGGMAWADNVKPAAAEEDGKSITMDEVPLTSAIRILARQAGMNCILDPAVPGVIFGPGRKVKEPIISSRWRNMTSAQALRALLKEHQLVLVDNPVTTVARIAPGKLAIKPVSTNAVAPDPLTATNKTVPLMVIDDVPFLEALKHLGKEAGLAVYFESKVTRAFEGDCNIYVRWEDLSARQALAALADNYGLVMRENRLNATAVFALKTGT